MIKERKVGNVKFWINDARILCCRPCNSDTDRKLDVEKARLYVSAITELCNGKAMPFLIDLRGTRGTFSISAAKLLAKEPGLVKLRISEAFITDSISMKLLIMTYKRLYDPTTRFGMFGDFESALKFCLTTKKEFNGSEEWHIE